MSASYTGYKDTVFKYRLEWERLNHRFSIKKGSYIRFYWESPLLVSPTLAYEIRNELETFEKQTYNKDIVFLLFTIDNLIHKHTAIPPSPLPGYLVNSHKQTSTLDTTSTPESFIKEWWL